jgi:hypothetical protein
LIAIYFYQFIFWVISVFFFLSSPFFSMSEAHWQGTIVRAEIDNTFGTSGQK